MASNVILFQQDAKLHKYTKTNKDNHSCAGYKKKWKHQSSVVSHVSGSVVWYQSDSINWHVVLNCFWHETKRQQAAEREGLCRQITSNGELSLHIHAFDHHSCVGGRHRLNFPLKPMLHLVSPLSAPLGLKTRSSSRVCSPFSACDSRGRAYREQSLGVHYRCSHASLFLPLNLLMNQISFLSSSVTSFSKPTKMR